MKNKLYVLLGLLLSIMAFQIGCVHEIPHDFCASDPVILSIAQTDATGNQADGTILATATGGSGIQYSLNGASYVDSGYYSGLQGNTTYQVVAKNVRGCTDTAQVLIGQSTPPDPCLGLTISVSIVKTDPSLNQSNGSITASASPGTGFTYSLNNGPFQNSGSFTGLAAGNYTVTAQNPDGCSGTSQTSLVTNDPCAGVTVTVSTTQVNPTIGQTNGSINASATGGTGFTYSLNNGAFQSSGNFSGLAAGNYSITAKNSNGCTAVKNITLTAVDPCAGITVVVSTTQVNPVTGQSNGSITASATGGSGFTYSINNGTFQSSGTFTGLGVGNYTITAKNSNGCVGVKSVSLGASNPCAGVTVVVTTTNVNPSTGQSNGSITASATGGSGFTYSINNGTFQSGGTFSALAAGTYIITAKNSQGCLGTKSVTLTATNPCAGVTITVATTKVNPTTGQSNGSISASATGATGFTYSINNGVFQTNGNFTALAAGTYTITAKSSQGCLGSTTVTLTAVNPCTNVNIVVTTSIVNVVPCGATANNGNITVTATGSTGYTYNINSGTYQASNIFNNLAAGTYTIGVKDANNCSKTATATIGTAPRGPLFAQVQSLIISRCSASSCHTNGGNKAGYNFDNDCRIVTAWSAIQASCVTSNSMPNSPQPQLTAAEKQKITNWINAGHAYGN